MYLQNSLLAFQNRKKREEKCSSSSRYPLNRNFRILHIFLHCHTPSCCLAILYNLEVLMNLNSAPFQFLNNAANLFLCFHDRYFISCFQNETSMFDCRQNVEPNRAQKRALKCSIPFRWVFVSELRLKLLISNKAKHPVKYISLCDMTRGIFSSIRIIRIQLELYILSRTSSSHYPYKDSLINKS